MNSIIICIWMNLKCFQNNDQQKSAIAYGEQYHRHIGGGKVCDCDRMVTGSNPVVGRVIFIVVHLSKALLITPGSVTLSVSHWNKVSAK